MEMSEQFPRQFLQNVPNGLNAQIFLHNLRDINPLLTEREGQDRHRQLPTSAHKWSITICSIKWYLFLTRKGRRELSKFTFLQYLFLSFQL
jgi:hypothetical protein